jgi:hypothetical protein
MADERPTVVDAGAEGATGGPADGPPRLLARRPTVINVGLERFADDLARQGFAVQHVHWSPPAGGDARLAELLAKLEG